MADFDVQGARKAGYSDKEIADHLAGSMKFDAEAARKSGYGDKEIIDHLSPGPGMVSRAASAVVGGAADAADWLATRGAKAGANILSLPGAVSKGFDWASEKTGLPKAAFGPAAWMTQIAGMPGMPSQAEYEKFLLDNPYLNVGPAGVAQSVARAVKGGSTTPETNLPGPVGTIVDKGAEGLLTAPMLGGAGAPNLVANTLGGSGSELAGQVAKQVAPEYETAARVGGGLIGGLGGAFIPSVVRRSTGAVKGAVAPFTEAGKDKIVGSALRDVATDPDAAITNLDKYVIGREAFPDTVPGFKLDAGKASRDPGLMAAADVRPDAIRGFNVQNNNIALTGALDTATAGMPPAVDAGGTVQKILADRFKTLVDARKAASDPLYTAARNFPDDLPISPLFKYADDAIAANKGEPKAVMEAARKLLFNNKGEPDFSAQGLMSAREGLGALFTPTLDKHSRELLVGLRNKIDETMQTVPEARTARATFQQYSQPLEPFGKKTQAGKAVEIDPLTKSFVLPEGKVLGDLRGQDVKNVLTAGGGDPTIKRNIASAYLDDFKATVGNAVQRDTTGRPMLGAYPAAKWMDKYRGDARNVLTDDQLMALDDITKHLGDQAQAVPGRSGSPTFDRLASESILSAIIGRKEVPAWLHPVQKALTLNGIIDIYGGANKQALDQLMKVIEDPAVTAALMKKATPGNVKMIEPLLQSLAKGAALPALTSGRRESP